MRSSWAIAFALLACVSCGSSSKPNPVPPRPTPVVVDVDLCDSAEAHLIALGCPEGQPTKRGLRFGDVCRELSAAGIFPNPKCLANVKSCVEVDVCTGSTMPLPAPVP